ncbi:hypothetical protein QC762_500760 [Podospora pseudocomata]|uniref:Major facilitator superfamily (MFS) profile domain-containing protein n=1 Tax=Podospora pseudocomata TaxID=2093779 RepID=A0ABR0GAD5_9PEZI|nr:hypothetical protein QC762_500760 [Podospora pseudocomata]
MSASFSAMFSTMSSYIYYPALVPVAHDLGVSVALVNLSVTTYLIVAAIAPAFMGDMADQTGRRPVFMVLFVLMISANAGDCPPNIIRRSPALVAITYGVIADIIEFKDRGGFVGVFLNRHVFILPPTPPTYPLLTSTTQQANSSIGTTATPSRNSNPPPTKPTSSPSKKTRLRGIYRFILISSLDTLGYGLALMTNAHISGMILMHRDNDSKHFRTT